MSNKNFLSIIIPVFNESRRIHNLTTISNYIKNKKFFSELIVVNDGSTDDTLEKLNNQKDKLNFKIISYKKNKGKGHAIKKGVLKSRGQFILFSDIDLSTPIEEFDNFLPFVNSFDVIIATRRISGSNIITKQPYFRENMGKIFTSLSSFILNLNISDFTCGFKLFSQKAGKDIFSKLTINRWGFDSELLFIANKKGYLTKEVGVNWKNDPFTKVKFPADALKSLIELVKIKVNDLKKVYG